MSGDLEEQGLVIKMEWMELEKVDVSLGLGIVACEVGEGWKLK